MEKKRIRDEIIEEKMKEMTAMKNKTLYVYKETTQMVFMDDF